LEEKKVVNCVSR